MIVVGDREVQHDPGRDAWPLEAARLHRGRLGYAPGAMRQVIRFLLDLLRPLVVLLGRFTRSGAAWPLRRLLRLAVGGDRYDRVRLRVWIRTKQAVRVDPLHSDVLPLIRQLESEGCLRAGAAGKLRAVAHGIQAESRREAQAVGHRR